MADCVPVLIAQGVVEDLNDNAASWLPQVFTADWELEPIEAREALDDLSVLVIPNSVPVNERFDRRNTWRHVYLTDIVIQAKLTDRLKATKQPFFLLAEQMADYFCRLSEGKLANYPTGVVIGVSCDFQPWPDHLKIDVLSLVVQLQVQQLR